MFLCVFWFRITKQILIEALGYTASNKHLQLFGGNVFIKQLFIHFTPWIPIYKSVCLLKNNE